MAGGEAESQTREEQIAHAKELYARGYRNYVVGDFNEAAEDLSRSCELYAKLYGDESDEVGVPNLFYGKTLIELAQMGENKVLALPDQEEMEDDEEEDDGDAEEEVAAAEDDDEDDDHGASTKEKNEGENEKPSNNGAGPSIAGASSSSSSEPQPGTSSGIQGCNGNNGDADNGTTEDVNENLQFAWEALEIAAKIFRRLGVGYEDYLAEAHYSLGEILMENQKCPEAIRDYNIAFELFSKVEPVKERHLAEIKYKTGLCHYTDANYDASIADFQKSADYMQQAIEAQKKLEQTPAVQQLIDDLGKTREDIIIKMADVQETKQLLRSNLITKGGYGALLAEDVKAAGEDKKGESSSASASASEQQSAKPKANDISHLIKRKKPDTPTENASDGASPAKKTAP